MDWQTACAAVIPCLNEGSSIGRVAKAAQRYVQTVVVVDDGSADDTACKAREGGATLLQHQNTQGKGAALQTGLNYVLKHGYKWAVTMDGDGQHSADDMPSFFQCAERSAAALVVGDRLGQASLMPWLRRWVNRWMSRRLSKLCGQSFPDSQCGFRLIKLADWERLRIESRHFEIESETLVAFASTGLLIQFVPIQVIYKEEHSKIHPLKDTVRWLKWWHQTRRIAR